MNTALANQFSRGGIGNHFDTPTARSGRILASPRAACRCRSYTRSTSVLCLGMPYRDEYSNTFVSDVFGRVMISIMPRATIGTIPETIRERKLLMAMTTLRTQLRRREPATDKDEVSVPPSGLVFDLPESLTMRRVLNRLGKQGCATCLSGSMFRMQSCSFP